MSLALELRQASPADDPERLAVLAERALKEGEEETALPLLERALERRQTARLWQWRALLERSLDLHEAALASFEEAERLAPSDAMIAHGKARVALEAGLDARGLYERALALAPNDGSIIIGHAASRAAAGDGDAAANDLADLLQRSPAWTFGHEQLAQLLATLGRADEATNSIEEALRRFPSASPLWETLLNIEVRRENYAAIEGILHRARSARAQSSRFAIYDGIIAAELATDSEPMSLFGPAARSLPELRVWRIRHLMRRGAHDVLIPLIDEELASDDKSGDLWAYAATAWRQSGDPRSEWLEGDPRLVALINLRDELPYLVNLAEKLRALHVAKGEYLDQSVRGGTQTDGPLLSRIDPEIRALRTTIVSGVRNYLEQLPPIDAGHPLLRHRRDRRIRFSGSWSVRLRSGGRHSNHIHPQGWISSALYIALPPESAEDGKHLGWFALGQPDETLGLDMAPWRDIRPIEGQLVLFPSWMWHGTVPFLQGERLTVAFDVAPPV